MADEAVQQNLLLQTSSEEDSKMEKGPEQSSEALLPRGEIHHRDDKEESAPRVAGVSPATRKKMRSFFARSLPFVILLFVVIAGSVYIGEKLEEREQRAGVDWGTTRPLKKLEKPLIILISSDGFHWTYNYKVSTPNIDRLRLNGTEAATGLIPVYPSLTFPNHYSIATGLYPAWHGVIANRFSDPEFKDPRGFYQGNIDPKWWGGEPIWVTATKNGLQAATYFWPGSEVPHGPWTCPKAFCQQYNGSVPYEERVDTVLGYMDLPAEERPSFISLYFESPDHEGHQTGPDSPEVAAAVEGIDGLMGRLIDGLEEREIFDDVTILLVGDHGMASNCDSKMIYLEDFGLGSDLEFGWVDSGGALLAIRPPKEVDVKALHRKMAEALASGNVKNSKYLQLFLKEHIPERFLYRANDRIQPIIGIPAEGFKVGWNKSEICGSQCGGQHGYDNYLLSMRTIFIGHGPQFGRGRVVPSFVNIELYNVMTSILGLETTAVNNGTSHFASTVLLPSR